jgi:hypothetical protein
VFPRTCVAPGSLIGLSNIKRSKLDLFYYSRLSNAFDRLTLIIFDHKVNNRIVIKITFNHWQSYINGELVVYGIPKSIVPI